MNVEAIDIEIMSEQDIIEAVDEAAQKAAEHDTVMLRWLIQRARVRMGGPTLNEVMLRRALDKVRGSATC